MKQFLSLLLVITTLACVCLSVFAVNYAEDDRNIQVTVPVRLLPGGRGTIAVEGKWSSNRKLVVIAPTNVVLTNSINPIDKKTLTISFSGIYKIGDNTQNINKNDDGAYAIISVSEISNALFGEWSGVIYYDVKMEDIT